MLTIETGSVTWTPIRIVHHSISREDLAALYTISDVCLVTSIRDGVKLVSYEYVVCQQERAGVLVLSKYAGAADTSTGCLEVDPTNVDELVQAIKQALEMDEDERMRRQQASLKAVRTQTTYVVPLQTLGDVC